LAFVFTQREQPDVYHQHTLGQMLDFQAWPALRDRQRRVLPGQRVGMVVTADVENDPNQVGERLARWALSAVYGRGKTSSGPLYRAHHVVGDRVIVEFDHTDGGLMAARIAQIGSPPVEEPEGRLRFFAVAGADRIFHRADAWIEQDRVVVRSRRVPHPVAVRYAWHFDPRGMNLYNRAGLPASPFRTDDWPVEDLEEVVARLVREPVDRLVAMLGYPTMLHSHGAARALAARGEEQALPAAEQLLQSDNPDERCGGLRILGYLYHLGPVAKGSAYYSQKPQEVTPAVGHAIELIAPRVKDPDVLVRRCAAEALALIGAENERVFQLVCRLAVDEDPLVRTAAMRLSKYRFKSHAHNTALAYALLEQHPFGDRTSTALAGMQLNHYRIHGEIDLQFVARYLGRIEPGRGGPVVSYLGDLLRRTKLPDGNSALNDPQVLCAILELYAIGYRKYMLYGVEFWIRDPKCIPVIREKVRELQQRIEQLEKERPPMWRDLEGRYAAAIEGLQALARRIEERRRSPQK